MNDSGVRLSGTNLERAADHNQRMALHAIRVHETLTRVDMARLTGLTAPAIQNIVRRLLQEELIVEVGRQRGGRGQPATEYAINRDACFAIGVNIDRDHITIVLVNFVGETLARKLLDIDFPLPSDVATFYRGNIFKLIEDAGISPDRIVGIGVAIPDDLEGLHMERQPDSYAEWATTDLAKLLSEPLDLPVFVENDATAAAMGEQQLGAGRHLESHFYILISQGLGGGLVIDGNYIRGANGRSAEIGFLRRGNARDSKESVQSLVSLAGLSRFLAARDIAPSVVFAESPAAAAESAIDEWLTGAAEALGTPLAAVNCLINPSAVLLSGRLPARHLDRLAEKLNDHMRSHWRDLPALAPISRAILSEDAPAVGAAILPFSHFLLPKAGALWKRGGAG